jgi:FkbM family methyltransferase
MLEKLRKMAYRTVRCHWATERLQYQIRRNPRMDLSNRFHGTVHYEMTVSPGEVIVDCGANIGDVTSMFARSGATVYAFEPNPLCYGVLAKRFAAMPSVHCINKGVTDHDSKLTLSTPFPHKQFDKLDTTITSSFVDGAMHPEAYKVQNTVIDCVDIDSFIKSIGRRVRLLKLDIEGMEVVVLNRLMNTGSIDLIDTIVAETHDHVIENLKQSTDALRQRVRAAGLESRIRLDWA